MAVASINNKFKYLLFTFINGKLFFYKNVLLFFTYYLFIFTSFFTITHTSYLLFISIIYYLLFFIFKKKLPWKSDLFQNMRISSVFKFDAQWDHGWFSLGDFHLWWKLRSRFSWWFSLRNRLKIDVDFQLMGENCPTLVLTTNQCWVVFFFQRKNHWVRTFPLQSTKFLYKIKSVKEFDGFTKV